MIKRIGIFLFLSGSIYGQLPETEIYLAKIQITNNLIKIDKAENITNHKGYDNQPSFTQDGKNILYSSEIASDKRIHACIYSIKSGKPKQLTVTNTSEYSPSLTPNGATISCVVVEEDSTQRVWTYDLLNGERKGCVAENVDSIGYHTWLGTDSLLYYKLTDPHSLRVLNLKTGEDNWLCDHPARSFKPIDKRNFFYVIQDEKKNLIMSYDVLVKKSTLIAEDKTGNQDYVWLASLGLLKSEGVKLYRYSSETKVWAEVADFSSFGIKKITRFAFSPDNKRLAVVSNIE